MRVGPPPVEGKQSPPPPPTFRRLNTNSEAERTSPENKLKEKKIDDLNKQIANLQREESANMTVLDKARNRKGRQGG